MSMDHNQTNPPFSTTETRGFDYLSWSDLYMTEKPF